MSESPDLEKVPCPAIDEFAEILADEPRWFDLGIYLEVPATQLNDIRLNYTEEGIQRCLIEIFKIIRFRRYPVTWYDICEALLRMDNEPLVERIREKYILRKMKIYPATPPYSEPELERGLEEPDPAEDPANNQGGNQQNVVVVDRAVTAEFNKLTTTFTTIVLEVRRGLQKTDVCIDDLQFILQELCELDPLLPEVATIERIFARLRPHYCYLNYHLMSYLAERFLPDEQILQDMIENYTQRLESFKDLPKVRELMKLIKEKRDAPNGPRLISLKLREFWGKVTLRKFERLARLVFHRLYRRLAHLKVTEGCIHVSWTMPKIDDVSLLISDKTRSTSFMDSVGVVSLSIDDTVIYKGPERSDDDTIEKGIVHSLQLGNAQAIEFMLKTMYDISDMTDTTGGLNEDLSSHYYMQSLYVASQNGHFNVVSGLLASGVSLVLQTSGAGSAIMAACENGHDNIVELLLKHGLDPNPRNGFCELAPIYLASENGHSKVISTLLQYGADPNIEKLQNRWTPLMIASATGNIEVVTTLLQHKNIKINQQANCSITSLHLAVRHGHFDITKHLLMSGADITLTNADGIDAEGIAHMNGHKEIVELLQLVKKQRGTLISGDSDDSGYVKGDEDTGMFNNV